MHGHGAHDDMSYVPPEMFEEWSQRDPIDLYSKRLADEHGFSADEVESIREEVKAYIADKDGVTPLTHAKRRGYKEIAAILQAAKAK